MSDETASLTGRRMSKFDKFKKHNDPFNHEKVQMAKTA